MGRNPAEEIGPSHSESRFALELPAVVRISGVGKGIGLSRIRVYQIYVEEAVQYGPLYSFPAGRKKRLMAVKVICPLSSLEHEV